MLAREDELLQVVVAYADAPIDYSYWNVVETVKDLHPDDRTNPIWNQDGAPSGDELKPMLGP